MNIKLGFKYINSVIFSLMTMFMLISFQVKAASTTQDETGGTVYTNGTIATNAADIKLYRLCNTDNSGQDCVMVAYIPALIGGQIDDAKLTKVTLSGFQVDSTTTDATGFAIAATDLGGDSVLTLAGHTGVQGVDSGAITLPGNILAADKAAVGLGASATTASTDMRFDNEICFTSGTDHHGEWDGSSISANASGEGATNTVLSALAGSAANKAVFVLSESTGIFPLTDIGYAKNFVVSYTLSILNPSQSANTPAHATDCTTADS